MALFFCHFYKDKIFCDFLFVSQSNKTIPKGKNLLQGKKILFLRVDSSRMDVLQLHVLFNSISVISGRWKVDNERLCAMNSVYG